MNMPAMDKNRQPNRSVSNPLIALTAKMVPVDKERIMLVEAVDRWNVAAKIAENAPYE